MLSHLGREITFTRTKVEVFYKKMDHLAYSKQFFNYPCLSMMTYDDKRKHMIILAANVLLLWM